MLRAQNLLMLATGELRHLVDQSSRRDVIHLTAEEGKTLVDMVTGCHDNELDVVAVDRPSSSHHDHHKQQPQQQQHHFVATDCSDTPSPNICPELFLNTCDDHVTSLSSSLSSSSSSLSPATASDPSHCPVASSCTDVPP